MNRKYKKNYLFSIDLEDVRKGVENGHLYENRVALNTYVYLDWLHKKKAKCTFFVTGDVAQSCPSLVKEIEDEGHEIACHSDEHIPLDKLTKKEFREDLARNIFRLEQCGISKINGFRAPTFSLTKDTQWVYHILEELGITYSSSVLPLNNPLYGWAGFSKKPIVFDSNVIELPITVSEHKYLKYPNAGGVYFRCIPRLLIKMMIKSSSCPDLIGYFHPYDIDFKQEKFMHPGINNSKIYNFLLFYNRKGLLKKLDWLLDQEYKIIRYDEYIDKHL